MAGSAIVVQDLSFAYETAPVLSDVNLTIDEGDFVSIIGPNGGGKTTLLKLMLGFLKPQTGSIRIFGEPPETARRRIGYVPQYFQFDPSFPAKVLDVVLMGRIDRRRWFGPYGSADKKAAFQALEEVDLYDLRNHPFPALSGGQRQRVLIARALASEPRVFFLDEPTANIDIAVQNEFLGLLEELNKRLTIIIVTHDIGFVSSLVKRVVCVNRRVLLHPISELTGDAISALYGSDVSLVRHDHHCAEKGHQWSNS